MNDHANQSKLLEAKAQPTPAQFHPYCRACRSRHLIGDCPRSRFWGVMAVVIWAVGVGFVLYCAVRRFF